MTTTISIIFLVILLIIAILWVIPAYTSHTKDEHGQIVKGSVASLEKIYLGDYPAMDSYAWHGHPKTHYPFSARWTWHLNNGFV